jgi:hypothetical protein
MAIYGDMLAAFPELMGEHVVFKMLPRAGAGYGPRYGQRTVTGYFSWIKGGTMGVEGDLRVGNQNGTLWEKAGADGKGVIEQGDYVEEDGSLFVFVHDDGYAREGGFIVHNLQLVPAFTGKQPRDEGVNIGFKDFR